MSPDGSMKLSPEERLLRLIRGKPAQAASAVVRPAAAGATASLSGSGTVAAAKSLQWPKIVAGALVVVLVVELMYLVVQLLRPLPSVMVPAVPALPITAPISDIPPMEAPSIAESVSRQLFVSSLISAPVASSQEPPPAGPSTVANDLAARLTLMGIVAGDPAQAVIEDGETKKTYFVSPGQVVVAGAVLEEVLDNRVILSLNGEKIALSL